MPGGYSVGGFEPRYVVTRADGGPCNPAARYMVLNLGVGDDGVPLDPHAREAAAVYARSVRPVNPVLADDLERMLRDGFPRHVAQHRDAR